MFPNSSAKKVILRIIKSIIKIAKKLTKDIAYFLIAFISRYRFRFLRDQLSSQLKITERGSFSNTFIQSIYELEISPNNLISGQYIGSKFNRLDTIVRYLAVEEYFHKNDFGFSLYKKMQEARCNKSCDENRFRNLIESVNKHGFDIKSKLSFSPEGYLIDGSHRLALSLYFNYALVKVKPIYVKTRNVYYGIDWFKENGFSESECKLIEERRIKLFWEKALFFPIILWPPVSNYFNKIEQEIPYRIIKSIDLEYNKEDFESKLRAIYNNHNIDECKIDNKLTHMQGYKKLIKVIWIELPDPKYYKKKNNKDTSRVSQKLKLFLSNNFKKKVPNYSHDIICHIPDNWEQNMKIMQILKIEGFDQF